MKRALSLVLAAALVLGSVPAGFAATSTAGETLKGYGLVAGDTNGNLNEDKTITRGEMMVVLARLLGKFEEAKAYSIPSTSKDVAGHWAANYIAYAEKEGWTAGKGNGMFDPQGTVTLQEVSVFMLKALGYTADWNTAVKAATDLGLLKEVVATDAAAKVLRSDVFTSALNTINTPVKDSTVKLGEKLGVLKPVVVAEKVDVKSAVALNSKTVEVALNTAIKTVDAKVFTVKDAAGAAVNVTAAELAAYDATGKTVLVTLEKDTTAGTLYTLTAEGKNVNFGGRAADTTKPTVSKVEATDYNKVEVTFSETVKLGGTIEFAKMYGDKAALAITKTEQTAKDVITLTTADQADATLYSVAVKGFTDLAGNKMADDTAKNFVGKVKDTSDQKVLRANGINPEEIIVEFGTKVNPADIKVENFKLVDTYASGSPAIAITAARAATTSDTDTTNTKLTSTNVGNFVILTVPGVKEATLYKLTVSNVGTLYGKSLSTTAADQTTTTIAVAKPATALLFGATPVAPTSNTEVVVSFKYKVDKTLAENVANYVIAEAYGTGTLAVSKAVLKDNGTDVKLTVPAMKAVLYKATITNIKDIYGNALKTESSYNVQQFAGIEVAPKISSITTASVGSDNVTLTVVFDQKVAADATDVSKYSINNGVGYPEKAVIDSTDAFGKTVLLTIPKTTEGKAYTLTVKGLANADGVAMATDGVTKTFAGKGLTATLPELVAVMASDNQTLKIYFDRAVTDSSIDTVVWNSGTKQLTGAFFTVDAAADFDLAAAQHVAYKDPSNENVLVVRIATDNAFKAANKDATLNAFKLTGTSNKFAANKNALVFAPIETEPTEIKIDAVMAVNSTTLRVYFNQPVYGTLATFADIDTVATDAYGVTPFATLSNPTAIDATNKVYDFKLSSTMTSGTYYLNVNPNATVAAGLGVKSVLTDNPLNPTDTAAFVTVNADNVKKTFAGTTTAASDIKNISVLMTNDKTLVVYYPELMDKALAETPSKYTLWTNAAASTAAKMTGNIDFATAHIGKIVYSSTTNTATITLNKAIVSTGAVYVKVDSSVSNATGTAFVQDGANAIVKQFALNTTAAPKVTISSAAYDKAAKQLTITLNQEAQTSVDIDTSATGAVDAATAITNFGTLFTLTMPGVGVISTIDAYTATSGNVDDTTAAATVKKIVVTFATNPTADVVGSVQIKATTFTGINGNAADTNSKVEFTQ